MLLDTSEKSSKRLFKNTNNCAKQSTIIVASEKEIYIAVRKLAKTFIRQHQILWMNPTVWLFRIYDSYNRLRDILFTCKENGW